MTAQVSNKLVNKYIFKDIQNLNLNNVFDENWFFSLKFQIKICSTISHATSSMYRYSWPFLFVTVCIQRLWFKSENHSVVYTE